MVALIKRETDDRRTAAYTRFGQPYLDPPDAFTQPTGGEPRFWTCVRTRPRWEKKFARWLQDHRVAFFLPIVTHETMSGRKRRQNEVPLFPGYVFVDGDHSKGDFDRTGIVVYVLKPRWSHEVAQLHRELWGVWCGLTSGLYVTPIQNLAAGERCTITRGSLQGVPARFERMGRGGRIVLQVDMMGGGLMVEIPEDHIQVCS